MKVAIFFDGQNFYRSLLRYDESLRVDYDRLATWITQQAGGANALFSGAYYYVGVSPDAPPLVEGFLKGLELRPGYFVKREPRVRRAGRCPGCGKEYEYTTEKRVDTRLVADLIHYAASNAFDAAVLVSGDDDFVPAVEAVNALGKQVWVATWSADELSKDLRVRCFGHIHLSDGVSGFRDPQSRARRQDPRARRQRRAPRVGGHLRTVLSSFPAKGGQRMNVTKSTKVRTWRQALVLLALLSLPLVPPAFASDFAQIVFFGDSLSDPGNHFIAFGTTAHQPFVPIPDDSYAIGGHHFSNGATWAEQLAQALHMPRSGSPALRAPGGFTNYAVGRARARPAAPVFRFYDLSTQVGLFLSDFGGHASPDNLYVIWIGGNDLRDALETLPSDPSRDRKS